MWEPGQPTFHTSRLPKHCNCITQEAVIKSNQEWDSPECHIISIQLVVQCRVLRITCVDTCDVSSVFVSLRMCSRGCVCSTCFPPCHGCDTHTPSACWALPQLCISSQQTAPTWGSADDTPQFCLVYPAQCSTDGLMGNSWTSLSAL